MFGAFDLYEEGKVPVDDFLRTVIGIMNEQRRNLIRTIFSYLDVNQEGFVPIETLKEKYTPARAPEAIRKKKTPEDIRKEFEDTFELYFRELVQNF